MCGAFVGITLTESTRGSRRKDCLQCYFFYHGATALVGQGLLIIEDSWSHSDTPHSVGLLDVTETSTWQNTTLTWDRNLCPRRHSNPQTQKARDRRPTP